MVDDRLKGLSSVGISGGRHSAGFRFPGVDWTEVLIDEEIVFIALSPRSWAILRDDERDRWVRLGTDGIEPAEIKVSIDFERGFIGELVSEDDSS